MARHPDRNFWNGRRVLLTGHTGFKGSWAALWLHALGAEVHGLGLPPQTDPSLYALARIQDGIHSHLADLRDRDAVSDIVRSVAPEIVIHMAAQAIVKTAIADPVATYATNVMGTVHLLDALRGSAGCRCILAVTSDKVYANDDAGRAFRESDPLGGKDPYSASKAATEMVVASYGKTYFAGGPVVASARGGNVIGGGDFSADRLVPDIVRAVIGGREVILRHPEATRPWQHVLDCIAGYLCYVEALCSLADTPRQMNFGPDDPAEVTVAELADRALAAIGATRARGWRHEPVPGSVEARSLAVDVSRTADILGFVPHFRKAAAVDWTMRWYAAQAAGRDARDLTLSQIGSYADIA